MPETGPGESFERNTSGRESKLSCVRHPMYDGVILSVLCLPLVLGSLWALIPALLVVILFGVRTSLEDRTLMEELQGYEEYAQRVRYRLVPLLW